MAPFITNTSVTVGTTPTALCFPNVRRESLEFTVPTGSAASVFFGGATVTTATGQEYAAGQRYQRDQDNMSNPSVQAAWYGIVASGTIAVKVQEVFG